MKRLEGLSFILFVLLISCSKRNERQEFVLYTYNKGQHLYQIKKIWGICENKDSSQILQTFFDGDGRKVLDYRFLKKGKIYYLKEQPFIIENAEDTVEKKNEVIVWTKFADFSDNADTLCWNTSEAKIGDIDPLFIKKEMCVEKFVVYSTKNEKIPVVLISYYWIDKSDAKQSVLFSEKYGIIKHVFFCREKICYMLVLIE